MKSEAMRLILLLLIILVSSVCGNGSNRRILHQPLYPESSYPTPDTNSMLLPPSESSDQPFFPESGTQDQAPVVEPPPPPSINISGSILPISNATKHPTNQTKKAAIVISIGIATLVFASGLVFFIICRKNKTKKRSVVRTKREGGVNGAPTSRFLYVGTVNPNNTGTPSQHPTVSSPDVIKHAIVPSIKRTPPPQEAPKLQPLSPEKKNFHNVFELKSSLPKRAKFGPKTPPPPNLALLQSITSQPVQPPSPPRPSFLSRQVTVPPKVISTWTNFINKPSESAFDSSFLSNGDHTEGTEPNLSNGDLTEGTKLKLKPSESASEYLSNGDLTEGTMPNLKPSESASEYLSNGDHTEGTKPKLKPLHWEKVRANSDKATAWDQLKPSSFQLNEDLMESLFGCNTNKMVSNESNRRPPVVAVQEYRILDPNKSQNIAILLRALNVTRDEVSQALRDGNTRALGAEVLETLMKMAPTKEQEIKLTGYKGDTSKLGSAEKFLKAILDIPFAFKRIESMLYQANFDAEVKYLIKSFQTLEQASSELTNSKLFLKLLEAVLTTGNRMNIGTNRGGAKSFKLETLLKLVDIKGTDGKTTLLHFVVQEVGPFTVTGLSREISSVKLAAGLDSDVLHSTILKLETELKKVKSVLEYEIVEGKFLETMKAFYVKAEEDICRVKESEGKAMKLVRDATEYFHGDVGKEERNFTRIFVIVRDFLLTLDYVCKDMGMVISNVRQDYSSSEESSSP